MATGSPEYDAVIVGAGIAGAIMAKELARHGKRVLILESGPRDRRDRVPFHDAYLKAMAKLPNAPYPPYWAFDNSSGQPDQEAVPRAMTAMTFKWPGLTKFKKEMAGNPKAFAAFNTQSYLTYTDTSEIPFLSTYERLAGGTTWHWLGTSLRFAANDFNMQTVYKQLVDWPLELTDLYDDYAAAENEIGVSADVTDQRAMEPYLGEQFPPGYEFPMQRIPMSVSDKLLGEEMRGLQFDGHDLLMTCTPQGRNSEYRRGRPACQGNSSCIPICPIEAKYDATATLREAENAFQVKTITQAVVTSLDVDETGKISRVNYLAYEGEPGNYKSTSETAAGTIVILAAHAIETVKILQMSRNRQGIANTSGQLGCNLMDHLCYLGYGLGNQQGFPYRGPRSGSGIESLRDGAFRARRSAWRVDVGNVGWEWADDDPTTSLKDFVNGTNASRLNPDNEQLFGRQLVERLNAANTRMFRLCYLVEQEPQQSNRITLSKDYTDGLGLPRPEINYTVTSSPYTLRGIVAAAKMTDLIFDKIGANRVFPHHSSDYTKFVDDLGFPGIEFEIDGEHHKANLYGAGHIVGTYRMGFNKTDSVVNSDLRSWDHKNLYLLGSGTFPTIATGNPTLTLAALVYRAARSVLKDLG
ncbi:MAG: GMC family oxidoreductase [Pseudomonadota bacterium]